jgi:hypothetical protein
MNDNYKLTGAYYPPSDYEKSEGKAPDGWLKFSNLVESCRQANETVEFFKASSKERDAFDEIFNTPISRIEQKEIDSGMKPKEFG